MKRLVTLALGAAVKVLLDRVYAVRQRRAMEGLDKCDFCRASDGDYFVDVTPAARHITARLACPPCGYEAQRYGAKPLLDIDGRPVSRG